MKKLLLLLLSLFAAAQPAAATVVTTIFDEDNGNLTNNVSLREAVTYSAAGAVITFDPSLNGRTCLLSSSNGEIIVTKNLTINASSLSAGLTIDGGSGTNRIFRVNSGQSLSLQGLTLTGGNGTGASLSDRGGAILSSGTLTLTRCTLFGNSASISGGAIYNDSGTLSLTHCTLSENSAITSGGAIYNDSGPLSVSYCTVSGNSATALAGAIYNERDTLTLTNCIVAGNSANTGADIRNFGDIANPATVTRVGANIIQELANNSSTATDSGPAAITSDPLLTPLGYFGGPTMIMHPLSGSPAIDAGNTNPSSTDQRGLIRFRDGDGNGTSLIDIGAVEAGSRVTITTAVDENDGSLGGGTGISLREAAYYASENAVITFAPGFNGGIYTLSNEIALEKSLFIDASSLPAGLTIDGGPGTNRIFFLSSGYYMSLHGLNLSGGNGMGAFTSGSGGAILNRGTLTLSDCTFFGNSAASFGSGGVIYNSDTLMLTQCTLSGNSANNGGAIYNNVSAELDLTHCTLSGNSATTNGGSIYSGFTSMTLTNCIVGGNTAASGADIYNTGAPAAPGEVTRVGANLIQTLVNGGASSSSGPAAITSAPLLAPLGDYGGPTRTMPPLPGSPAIDTAVGSLILSDQRGLPINGSRDIGAAENQGDSDLGRFWLTDWDRDGNTYGIEYIVGTNPELSDRSSRRNLAPPSSPPAKPPSILAATPASPPAPSASSNAAPTS